MGLALSKNSVQEHIEGDLELGSGEMALAIYHLELCMVKVLAISERPTLYSLVHQAWKLCKHKRQWW